MPRQPSATESPWPGDANAEAGAGGRRRGWRRWRWVLAGSSLALLAIWGLYRLALPPYLTSAIGGALEARGYIGSSFELQSVSLSRLTITDVRLGGEDRMTAAEVTADYSVRSLWHRRVERVALRGFRWQISVGGEAVDLGLESRGGKLDLAALPFDRVDVYDAVVAVDIRGTPHRARIDGVVRADPEGLTFEIEGWLDEAPLRARGAVRPGAAGEPELDIDLELYPDQPDRQIVLRASGARDSLQLVGAVRWPRLAVALGQAPLELDDVVASGELELSGSRIRSADIRATSAALRVDAHAARDLVVRVEERGEQLAVTGSATGDGWDLAALTATVPRDVSTWPPDAIDLTWEASGSIPAALRERLVASGLSVDLARPATLRGHGSLEKTDERWLLAIASSQVALAMKRLAVAPLELRLRGVEAALEVSGTITSDRVDLDIAPGSVARAARVARTDGRVYASSHGRERPALSLALDGSPARVRLPLDAMSDWRLSAPAITARMRGIRYRGRSVDVRGLGGTLHLALDASRGQLVLESRRRGTLSVGGVTLGERSTVSLKGCRPTLLPSRRRPLVRLLTAPSAPYELRLEAAARCRGRLTISGLARGRVGALAVSVRGRFAPGLAELAMPVHASIERLGHPASDVVVSDAEIDLPLRWGKRPAAGGGRVRVGDVRWKGRSLGSLELSARQTAARSFSLDGVAKLAGAHLDVRSALELGQDLAARAELTLPPTTIAANTALGDLASELAGVRVSGRISGSASIDISPAGRRESALLEATGVTLASTDGDRKLVGLQTTLVFKRLGDIATAGRQRLRWRSATIGKYELGAGSVRFAIANPKRFVIDRASVSLGKGTLRLSPFTFDPKAIDIKTSVQLRGVQLARWLPLLSKQRATGTGTLDGRLPVRIQRTPRLRIELGEGTIAARGRGCFKIGDIVALGAFLSANAADASYSEMVKQRVVQSLSDFCYRQLQFDVERSETATRLRIHTRGKGRKVPQEIDLTVNINGFEELFDPALRMFMD